MPRIGLYPGSFDPPTLGHLDLIERASGLVDHLVVAVGFNSTKEPFLPNQSRVEVLKQVVAHLPNVEVAAFEGLLVHYAQKRGAKLLIRGLRAVTDYDYEFRIAMANRGLDPDIETVFLLARDEYSFLASSVVREVATLGGDYQRWVPEAVAPLIEKRIRGGS